MERAQVAEWVDAYERAWRTAGTDHLGELFTQDATYLPSPFAAQIEGLDAIAGFWEEEREGHDEVFTLESEVVAVDGDTGVVRCDVAYGEPHSQLYRDLWIVRLDEHGRCFHFEEWPFWPERGSTP
jgi:ketosteroid isomerase-like protein